MSAVKRTAARWLRRWANRLDPQKPRIVLQNVYGAPGTTSTVVANIRWHSEQGSR